MHELFLTAVVVGNDLPKARAVLQGYSAMSGRHNICRVLYFAGPKPPRTSQGLPQIRALHVEKEKRKERFDQTDKSWAELHQIFTKQSFIFQARYPVGLREFGDDAR